MDLRGLYGTSNISHCMDLLRGHLRPVGLNLGLDSRSHYRTADCCGDYFSVAIGGGSASICDLQSFWRSSGSTNLHCRVRWHHRHRIDLVVAHGAA